MIYLATPSTNDARNACRDGRLGAMLTPQSWSSPNAVASAFVWWAGDSGCYTLGDDFSWPTYEKWLREMADAQPESCLFVTAPDRVGDHTATVARFNVHKALLGSIGLPVAFVAQDGATSCSVPWDEFDTLFMGGTTEFKLSEPAYKLAAEAQRQGKWTHMGRVNSYRRLRAAAAAGYDSCDGTFLAFGPDKNLPKLLRWLDHLDRHPPFALGGAVA